MSVAVKNGMLVTLFVRMADMTGKILEESEAEGVTYIQGRGEIFPKLEEALDGRFPGEGFFIKLEPEDAFGQYDEEGLKMVPLEHLGSPEAIVPGLVFEGIPGEVNDGRQWRVTDVAEGMAVLETNHPLAGLALQFEIKVLKVAEPGEEELAEYGCVPGFLSIADKLVSEDEEDLSDQEMNRLLDGGSPSVDTPMSRMATAAPRIIR